MMISMAMMSVLDRVDWPEVGDEVLYRLTPTVWKAAIVLAVRPDGSLELSQIALPARNGRHVGGWITYDQAKEMTSGGS